MKKLRLSILLSLILIIIPFIPSKGTLKAEQFPVIFFEDPKFDFGSIFKGQKVEHVYKFENKGKIDLEISKVKSSCGCTAAVLSNKTIPPGKTGEIKATFNSGSNKGRVAKTITVISNDPDHSSFVLTISGEVVELISVSPKSINFGQIYIGGEISKKIKITSGSLFKIKDYFVPSKPFITASIEKESGLGYTVNVILKDNNGIGRFSGAMYIETDNTDQPNLKIPFFGEIIGDITIYPKKIYYGAVSKGKEKIQKMFVKVNKDNIEILGVKVSPKFLSAEIIKNYKKNKSQYLIEIKLHGYATIGRLNGILEIKTNSEIQPSIKVPIVGEIT